MKKNALLMGVLCMLVTANVAFAQDLDFDDGSLLGALQSLNTRFKKIQFIHHVHPKGQWMVGYRYKVMTMDGNRDGTKRLSTADVLGQYRVAPLSMTMHMHMISAMYGLTNDVTLMLMVPYRTISMENQMRSGMRFTAASEGLGDVKATVQYVVYQPNDRHRFVSRNTLTFPTGSIDVKGVTPMSNGQEVYLPYPMQLGSGSFTYAPNLIYLGYDDDWAWRVGASATFPVNENASKYRVGNQYSFSAEGLFIHFNWLLPAVRLEGKRWEGIRGADPRIPSMPNGSYMVPTADPSLRGGTQVDAGLSLTFHVPRGPFEDLDLSMEFVRPLYRNLDGPQLETDALFDTYVKWSWYF